MRSARTRAPSFTSKLQQRWGRTVGVALNTRCSGSVLDLILTNQPFHNKIRKVYQRLKKGGRTPHVSVVIINHGLLLPFKLPVYVLQCSVDPLVAVGRVVETAE